MTLSPRDVSTRGSGEGHRRSLRLFRTYSCDVNSHFSQSEFNYKKTATNTNRRLPKLFINCVGGNESLTTYRGCTKWRRIQGPQIPRLAPGIALWAAVTVSLLSPCWSWVRQKQPRPLGLVGCAVRTSTRAALLDLGPHLGGVLFPADAPRCPLSSRLLPLQGECEPCRTCPPTSGPQEQNRARAQCWEPTPGRGQAGGGRAAQRVGRGALRKAEAGDALRLCRGRERVKATDRTSLRRGCWPGSPGRGSSALEEAGWWLFSA